MQRYRQEWIPGATYFFTVVTYQRQKMLTDAPIYHALKTVFREVMQTHPFTIDAFVLLPDHLHCIWTMLEHESDFSVRWSLIKRKVSQQFADSLTQNTSDSRTKRRESTLWQRRFWEHKIRDDGDFERHVDYIHYNPVKHGYAKTVKDWPYSSFHAFVKRGVLPLDWGLMADVGEDGFGE